MYISWKGGIDMMSRTRLITAASFAGSLGWGTILPFQYAYVVGARHWGPTAGVLAGTAFCLGAVVAASVAGRLADRYSAGPLATLFTLAAGVSSIGLGLASSPVQFLAAIALFGGALTAVGPATQVLVLECVAAEDRRSVFAYQFTALALGMAAGAFAAGLMVDLTSPSGMWPGFLTAAVGFALSAVLLHLASDESGDCAGKGLDAGSVTPGGWDAYRQFVGNRQIRLLALVSMALAAGFYAQFETGLPAFALQALAVRPSVVGTAAAANCLVIVALQWLVVRLTDRHRGAALLIAVASIWVMSWLLLEVALFVDASTAGVLFVIAFMTFALGETMYAPILSPLAASVAPTGMVGTTIGTLSALRTGVSAAGPLVAGVLLALDVPQVFVLVHVAINALGGVFAWRLLRAQRSSAGRVDTGQADPLRSAHV
jgi:MFS family permease